jgi:Ca2+-binding RTX toxin-like protein
METYAPPGSLLNANLQSDFAAAQLDKIQLSKADFGGLGPIGALGSAAFFASATATAANDADDRIVYNTTSGALYYDADGLGGQAAVQIATFGTTTHPGLVFSDFQIVA